MHSIDSLYLFLRKQVLHISAAENMLRSKKLIHICALPFS